MLSPINATVFYGEFCLIVSKAYTLTPRQLNADARSFHHLAHKYLARSFNSFSRHAPTRQLTFIHKTAKCVHSQTKVTALNATPLSGFIIPPLLPQPQSVVK